MTCHEYLIGSYDLAWQTDFYASLKGTLSTMREGKRERKRKN